MSLYQLYFSCTFNNWQSDTTDRCSASSVHLSVVRLTTVACKQLKGVVSLQYVNVVVSATLSCKVCYWKLYILGFSFAIITNISCNFKITWNYEKRMKELSFRLSLKHLCTSPPFLAHYNNFWKIVVPPPRFVLWTSGLPVQSPTTEPLHLSTEKRSRSQK